MSVQHLAVDKPHCMENECSYDMQIFYRSTLMQ